MLRILLAALAVMCCVCVSACATTWTSTIPTAKDTALQLCPFSYFGWDEKNNAFLLYPCTEDGIADLKQVIRLEKSPLRTIKLADDWKTVANPGCYIVPTASNLRAEVCVAGYQEVPQPDSTVVRKWDYTISVDHLFSHGHGGSQNEPLCESDRKEWSNTMKTVVGFCSDVTGSRKAIDSSAIRNL